MSSSFKSSAQEIALTLRFIGEELNYRPIPIYDLGQCLTAIQKIYQRAYLSTQNRLSENSRLSPVERRNISLSLVNRRSGSDIYELIGFAAASVIALLAIDVIRTFGYYVFRNLSPEQKPEVPSLPQQLSIFQEIDPFDLYKQGLQFLKHSVDNSSASYQDLLILEHRLRENIYNTRRYGDSENLRSERFIIIEQLNHLALLTKNITFNDICHIVQDNPSQIASLSREEMLARLSYKDVQTFTQRIDKSGLIRIIEIYSPMTNLEPIQINQDTKDYVKSLENTIFFGEIQRIQGRVTKLFVESNSVELLMNEDNKVKVYLDLENFKKVRHRTENGALITFLGRPMMRFGIDKMCFDEFEARQILLEDTL